MLYGAPSGKKGVCRMPGELLSVLKDTNMGNFPGLKQELSVFRRIKISSRGFGGFSCRVLLETEV